MFMADEDCSVEWLTTLCNLIALIVLSFLLSYSVFLYFVYDLIIIIIIVQAAGTQV